MQPERSEEEQTDRDDLAHAVFGTEKPTGSRIERLRWVVEHQQAARIEGAYVDVQTANACVKVHDALSPANRTTFVAMTMRKMGLTAWKLVR